MTPIFVRTVRAHEGETVEVQWRLRTGDVHIERYTCPPSAVIASRARRTPAEADDAALEAVVNYVRAVADALDAGKAEK